MVGMLEDAGAGLPVLPSQRDVSSPSGGSALKVRCRTRWHAEDTDLVMYAIAAGPYRTMPRVSRQDVTPWPFRIRGSAMR